MTQFRLIIYCSTGTDDKRYILPWVLILALLRCFSLFQNGFHKPISDRTFQESDRLDRLLTFGDYISTVATSFIVKNSPLF